MGVQLGAGGDGGYQGKGLKIQVWGFMEVWSQGAKGQAEMIRRAASDRVEKQSLHNLTFKTDTNTEVTQILELTDKDNKEAVKLCSQ